MNIQNNEIVFMGIAKNVDAMKLIDDYCILRLFMRMKIQSQQAMDEYCQHEPGRVRGWTAYCLQ